MAQNIVGSNFPDFASEQLEVPKGKPGYGQNQFSGASSDLPGEKTTSGFLPAPGPALNSQMRTLPPGNVPDSFGMKRQTKGSV